MSDDGQIWKDRYWTSGEGLRLHYRDYPGRADRPPILCLHGLTRNARDFEDFAAAHAGEWRVLAPDFRGRGLSDHDPQPQRYAPPIYAGDVLALLAGLGIDQAVFVGTSLGGIVTMLVGAAAPRLIAAAVLNDVGPEIDPAGLARIATYVGRPARFGSWQEAARALAAEHGPAHPNYGDGDWLKFARRVCRETEDGIAFDYDMAIAENFRAAQDAPAVDAWPLVRALAANPLLILRGETSDLLSPATAARMSALHPDAEVVTVPGVGHAPDLSEPEAAQAIERLLARVAG